MNEIKLYENKEIRSIWDNEKRSGFSRLLMWLVS